MLRVVVSCEYSDSDININNCNNYNNRNSTSTELA